MKQLIFCIIAIICFGCKKSNDNAIIDNNLRVVMTSNSAGPSGFTYAIRDNNSIDPFVTLQSSTTNVTSVDYSFVPQPGGTVQVQVSSLVFTGGQGIAQATVSLTYKGQSVNVITIIFGSSTLTYQYFVPN